MEGRKILLLLGFELRPLGRPAHSSYRLSYPGFHFVVVYLLYTLWHQQRTSRLRRLQSLTLCGAVCIVSFRRVVMKVIACSAHNDAASNSDCTAANHWGRVNSYFYNLHIYRRCQYRNCACAASTKGLLMDVELLKERKLTRETKDTNATLPTTNPT
jgi:hypothetical protein